MGFEIKRFHGDVDEEFICPICKGVLEDPLQAPACEHAFCRACINEWISRQPTCPVDRQPVTAGQLRPVPRVLRNLLSRLCTSCDNAPHGCNAVLNLDSLASHLVECSFKSGTVTGSPFGGFKSTTATSAFCAPPASGAATSTQPTTGGVVFCTTNSTGGLCGGSTASTSMAGFGASTSGCGASTLGFGARTSGFGVSTSGFGASTSGFGASTSGFGASTSGSGASTSGLGVSTSGFGASTSGFGASTSGFGVSTSGFGASTSGFGASTSGFGASTSGFGASTSGLGASTLGFRASTSGFGASTSGFGASTSGFGASTSGFGTSTLGFGFGAVQPAGGGLFGNTSTVGGGLLGTTHNQTAFGAKPTGLSSPGLDFGGTTTTGATTVSLFGSTPSTGTGLFGQHTNTLSLGGGLATGAFGHQQQQSGTAHVKYNPVVDTQVVDKSGTLLTVNLCDITWMKEYENKSLEELRLEDYMAGRKRNTSAVFGGFQEQTENKPLRAGNTLFGDGSLGGTTGSFATQPSCFSFANNAQSTNSTGLFGANKPAFGAAPTTGGTGLFGAATAQSQAPTFGTNTSTFGFGATATKQNQPLFGGATTGLGSSGAFGAKTKSTTFSTQAPGEFNPKGPMPCELGCGLVIPKDELAEHNCVRELRALIATHQRKLNDYEQELAEHKRTHQGKLNDYKQELAEHKRDLALLKEFMRETRLSNPSMRAQEQLEVVCWANSLPRARVIVWCNMIISPGRDLEMIIKSSLSESGCPPDIIDDLVKNCHERRWPTGLQYPLETTDLRYPHETTELRYLLEDRLYNNRLKLKKYVCRRVPGMQAVLVLHCDNTHMDEDMVVKTGFVVIFNKFLNYIQMN